MGEIDGVGKGTPLPAQLTAQPFPLGKDEAEQEFRKQSEWLRITLSSIGDAVITTDSQGNVTFLNHVAESLTGWSLADARNQPIQSVFNIVNEHTRKPAEIPAIAALEKGVIVGLANHTILIAKDGTERPIDDSAAPMRDEAGAILGAVLIFRDITERKRSEEIRTRLAAIVETSDDAIISKTIDGIIRTWNAAAERLFGYTPEEVIGKPITIIIPEELQDEEKMIIRRLRNGERIEHFETIRIAKDGRRIEISLTVSPLRDGMGKVIGASKIARNITEQKRAGRALQESLDRQRFLAELASATQSLTQYEDLLAGSARMLAEHLKVDRCAYADVENESIFVITGDYSRGVPSIVGRWPVTDFGRECSRQMLANEPFVVHDVDNDPRISAADREVYRSTNIRAIICVPLHQAGKFSAAIAVHQKTSRQWSPEEVQLVTTVVGRCWEALERARVNRILKVSEARYRAIIEAIPECVKLVDSNGVVLQINSSGLKMIEAASAENALGKSVYDVIAPEDRENFRKLNAQVCQGKAGSLAYEIVGLRGTRRRLETNSVPLAAGERGFHQLAVTRDVTERDAAERAIENHRARLNYAVQVSGLGFWYCDLPFHELIWDDRVKDHFWLEPNANVTIETFYDRLHPDDRERTRLAIDASIKGRTLYDVDYRTIDPQTGGVKWIHAIGGATYGPEGSPQRFDGVTVDVTDRKLDALRLENALAREKDQGRILQQVGDAGLNVHSAGSIENVLDAICSEAKRILGARHSKAKLVHRSEDRIVRSISTVDDSQALESEGDAVTVLQRIAGDVCEQNRPIRLKRTELQRHPYWKETKSEQVASQGLLIAPFISREGKNLGFIQISSKEKGEFDENDEAILVQLAHIASVALENARLYSEMRHQDRRKDEFLALLAHELRNPLAPIRNGLQVMKLAPDDVNAVAQARAMMDRQLGHMVRLIDDLLDVSRISRNKMELRRSKVLLADIVRNAVESSRPAIDAAEHTLTISLPPESIFLDADLTRLSQVFSNLLTNSAKYTSRGGSIWLEAKRLNGEIEISVRDTGIGIPPDALVSIFDMFSQVDRSIERATGGLGIGLALVKGLVEMHDGRVEAFSDGPGKGSHFVVRLPILSEQPSSENREPANEGGHILPKRKFLVVDDNRDSANSMAMMLSLLGNDVSVAHDGLQAIEMARSIHPDVVLMDVGMPKLNGYDASLAIRKEDWARNLIIIALTGWGQETDRTKSQQAGCDAHLVKPVDLRDLEQLLNNLSAAKADDFVSRARST